MSESAIQLTGGLNLEAAKEHGLPPVPWRDPHTVSPEKLKQYIALLEEACILQPANADIRTCLGMAHAMNYDVYKSLDAFEEARRIQPDNFFAQLKYAELHYRLRALNDAERETSVALEMAQTPLQLGLARKQLREIRELRRNATQRPEWTKSLKMPALAVVGLFVMLSMVVIFR